MKLLAGVIISGAASGVAYLAAQAVDVAVTGNRTDDRILLGRLLPVRRSNAALAGTLVHLANSVLFSLAFRWVGRDRLTGPLWV